jgi:DNA-binding response OmpR family regulator
VTKVLIIDDDRMVTSVAAASLSKLGGMEVRSASSGEEGLRLARAERFDCVLLDVEMPGMSGLETFAALRADAATAAVPVIFLTGRSTEAEIREIEALEPLGVLAKPFGVTALAGQVRALLETR